MDNLNKILKKTIDFEEKTKEAKKSTTILIDGKNKDITVKIITKRSM